MAQRVGRGIALLIHDLGARRGEWSAARPGRSLPPGKTRYPMYRRLGGPQGPSGRAKILAPTVIRSPDRPACSQSPYRLSYPAQTQERVIKKLTNNLIKTKRQMWVRSSLYTVHRTLYTTRGTPYTVHYTQCTIHCTLHAVPHILYTTHSAPYTVHYTLYPIYCTLHTVHHTLYTTRGTPYTVHYTQCTVHYTLHAVPHILYSIHYTRYPMYCTLHTVHHTLYTTRGTTYTVHYTQCTVHYTLHAVPHVLYTTHSAPYTIHYTRYPIYCTLHTIFLSAKHIMLFCHIHKFQYKYECGAACYYVSLHARSFGGFIGIDDYSMKKALSDRETTSGNG